jgi:hypothetical protein
MSQVNSLPTTPSALQDLYGDQLSIAVAQAAATMDRPEYNGRLQKAMDFVLTGAVTLHDDGTATVKSGSHTYQINGECSCAESQSRSKYCKHFLAVQLLTRTLERLHLPTNGTLSQPAPETPQAPQSATWQCAQAPSSCTLKWSLNGIELLLTLRAATDEDLFERIKRVLPRIQDKVDAKRQARQEAKASQQPPASPPAPEEENEPWCAKHDVAFRRFTKGDQAWFSHQTAEGTWCRGK